MSIISLFVFLIVLGVAVWLVNTYIPMDPNIKKVLTIAAVIIAVLVLVKVFGIFEHLNARVPTIG